MRNDGYIATIYQKRWKVEEYHKSLKPNATFTKSPTRRAVTQISHLVMSMIAVFNPNCNPIIINFDILEIKPKFCNRDF